MLNFYADAWDALEPQPRGLCSIDFDLGDAWDKAKTVGATVLGGAPGYVAEKLGPDGLMHAAGASDTDTTQLQKDKDEARLARDKITSRLESASPYTAPTIQHTAVGPAAVATGASVGTAPMVATTTLGAGQHQNVQAANVQGTAPVTAQTLAAPRPAPVAQATAAKAGPAATAAAPGGIGTSLMAAASLSPAAKAQAAQVAAIKEATAPTVQRTALDMARSDEVRAQQGKLADLLTSAAAGNGPSAAQALLQLQTEKAKREQMGLAIARAHGGNVGLAQREAGENIAQIEGDANAQAAALRAKEQQDAQSKLADVLAGTRGADINLTTTGAQLASQANLTEAQLQGQTGLANLDVRAKTALTQAQLEQEAAQANAAREQQTNLTASGFQQEANKTNAGERNLASRTTYQTEAEAAQAQAARDQQVLIANAANQQAVNLLNPQEANRMSQEDAERALKAGMANQSTALSAATTTAQLTSAESIERAQLTTKVAMDNASRELDGLKAQAAINAQKGIVDAQLQTQIQEKQGELDAHMQEFNALEQNKMTLAQGEISSGEAKANLSAQTSTQDLNARREMGLTEAELEADKSIMGADQGILSIEQADAQRRAGLTGGVLQTVGSGATAMFGSDRRMKKDIADILTRGHSGNDELLDAFAAINPVSFRYKDPNESGAGPGKRYGVLAQDLEKTPAGKSVVVEDNGVKKIDTAAAVGLALAAIADIRKQMQGLKAKRGRR